MNNIYQNERDGQLHFFKNFGIDLDENNVLIANTDGVHNGNILEFKLNINNTQQVLFQAIKYLSRLRIAGNPVPKNILLISLNQNKVYVFDSEDYFEEIHKIYYGGASKNNDGFEVKKKPLEIDYSTEIGADKVLQLLKENLFTKIKIDEDCIVGWAKKFYNENSSAKKGDFLDDKDGGEIRKPVKFKNYILPFKEKTNIRFKYLMDKLNDNLIKKELGAFFTPPAYANKSVELVREAIKLVPKGNDYIILDRCAGTGSLESKLSDEELEHTIVSTYEYYEYKVLLERFNGRVRHIIPPTDDNVEFSAGLVENADALSEGFVKNSLIQQYINNPKCTIILFENPPFRDDAAKVKNKKSNQSFVRKEFIKLGTNQASHRDLANLFIWSGFNYYLRQKTDSYILFSPVKYWKSLSKDVKADKKFKKGFLFNRKFFHASASSISCIWWKNEIENIEQITLSAFDIDSKNTIEVEDDEAVFIKDVLIKKVHKRINDLKDNRSFEDDIDSDVFVELSGQQSNKYAKEKAKYNKNIVGFLRATSFNLDASSRCLTRTITYDAMTQHYGFYLRKDNFLEKLPLFVTKLYPQVNWYEKDVYFTTADGGERYLKDKDFLKSCLIFACLSRYNKCISFVGTDKRLYLNELCFGSKTLASDQLGKFILNSDEKELFKIWKNILIESKEMKNYNEKFSYGPYQIEIELNTSYKDGNDKIQYDSPSLNGELDNLKKKLKLYYAKYITPKLFDYELLK